MSSIRRIGDQCAEIAEETYSPPLPYHRVMILTKSSSPIFPETNRAISEVLDGQV